MRALHFSFELGEMKISANHQLTPLFQFQYFPVSFCFTLARAFGGGVKLFLRGFDDRTFVEFEQFFFVINAAIKQIIDKPDAPNHRLVSPTFLPAFSQLPDCLAILSVLTVRPPGRRRILAEAQRIQADALLISVLLMKQLAEFRASKAPFAV